MEAAESHGKPVDEVVAQFQTDVEKGLTQAQRASLYALGAIEHPPVSDI